jgi:hypothetical protein
MRHALTDPHTAHLHIRVTSVVNVNGTEQQHCWRVHRTYAQMIALDTQLHKCIFSRAVSQLAPWPESMDDMLDMNDQVR